LALAFWTLAALLLVLPPATGAQARKAAPKAASSASGQQQPKGEQVEISGRVAAGLDKTFIKDQSQGYFLVQGVDLSRFAGRHIQAKAVIVGQEREFRVVRLLDYTIKSPDDDTPGASASKKK
jgi:hypothetical protein